MFHHADGVYVSFDGFNYGIAVSWNLNEVISLEEWKLVENILEKKITDF